MKQIRLLTAVAFLVASAASATVFQPTSDRQLVDRSEAVVVATVRDAVSRVRADGYVVTDYRFDVEQTLKGTAAGSITVSEIGGVAGTRFTYISDSAAYTPGERVLVFLRKRGDGTYFTTSMAMGKFSFTRNAAGEAVVTRDVSELPGDPARMADTFSRFVRDSAQGNANKETYTAKLTPIANALHPHPLDLAPASAYCLSFGQPLRWPGGESGTVHFFVTGTMPNVPNAATNIANGLAAWTNDPNAGIVLAGGNAPPGGTSATPAFDGLNVIYLNQTPPGNGLCDQTFFCTVDSGHTEDTHTFHGETFISIEDADIVMGGSAGPTEFETLITHELGHAIGFRHSDDSQHYPPPYSFSAIMTSAVNPAFGSNLQQYDRDAVDTVYGNGPDGHADGNRHRRKRHIHLCLVRRLAERHLKPGRHEQPDLHHASRHRHKELLGQGHERLRQRHRRHFRLRPGDHLQGADHHRATILADHQLPQHGHALGDRRRLAASHLPVVSGIEQRRHIQPRRYEQRLLHHAAPHAVDHVLRDGHEPVRHSDQQRRHRVHRRHLRQSVVLHPAVEQRRRTWLADVPHRLRHRRYVLPVVQGELW